MAFISIVERANDVGSSVEIQSERVRLVVDVARSGCRVARQDVDLRGNGVPPAVGRRCRTRSKVVRIGGIHGRRTGRRHTGVETVFDLQVLDALHERHDVESGDAGGVAELRALEGGNAVAGLIVVGDKVDVGAVLVFTGQRDTVLL